MVLPKNTKLFFVSFLIIFTLFSLDIFTKRLAFANVDEIIYKTSGIHTHIKVNDCFNIVKVINNGVSFGMFNNLKYGQIILSAITTVIIAFLFYLLYKNDRKYSLFVYSIIIAGGFGNLYDRIIYGGVFDFLDFHIGEYHWPAFNVADSLICIGVAMIFLDDIIKHVKNNKKA